MNIRTINSFDIEPGMQMRWLGEWRTIKRVRRSLGNGHVVTFDSGLTANCVSATVREVK